MSAGQPKSRYILRADHQIGGETVLRRGDRVERFLGQDFGTANADRRRTRIPHICVARSAGDGEFLSVPCFKLKRL